MQEERISEFFRAADKSKKYDSLTHCPLTILIVVVIIIG